MTRLYGENAEKECAYLPQMQALVNRESCPLARPTAARTRPEFHAAFRPKRAALAQRAGPGVRVPRMRLTALCDQLSRYQPADATEARFVLRMSELTGAEAACARSHFTPGHFTASAFVLR